MWYFIAGALAMALGVLIGSAIKSYNTPDDGFKQLLEALEKRRDAGALPVSSQDYTELGCLFCGFKIVEKEKHDAHTKMTKHLDGHNFSGVAVNHGDPEVHS